VAFLDKVAVWGGWKYAGAVATELLFGLWSLLFREWSFLAQLGAAGLLAGPRVVGSVLRDSRDITGHVSRRVTRSLQHDTVLAHYLR